MSAKETAREVIEGHNLISVATVGSDGTPYVRRVDYAVAESGHTLYFITHKDSRKVRQIRENGNVAVAIDHDCPGWEELQKLKYIKGSAAAAVVDDPDEREKAFGLLGQKFPFLKDLPGEPSDFVCVRLALKEILVTDNTLGFGHTESVTY